MRKGGGLAMNHLDDRCQLSKSTEKIAPTIVLELAFSAGFYGLSLVNCFIFYRVIVMHTFYLHYTTQGPRVHLITMTTFL